MLANVAMIAAAQGQVSVVGVQARSRADHRRDLASDLAIAEEIAAWIEPAAGEWVADLSTLAEVISNKPAHPKAREK